MSDEQDPPPLRLRPRARPEAAPEAAAKEAEASGEETPRLRLKPRLGTEAKEEASAASAETAPKVEPASEEPAAPRLKPRLAVSRETTEVPELDKPVEPSEEPVAEVVPTPEPVSLKLRPKLAAEPTGTAAPPLPAPPPSPPPPPPPKRAAASLPPPPPPSAESSRQPATTEEGDARVLRPKVPRLEVPVTSEDELAAVAASLPPPPGTYASRQAAARRRPSKSTRVMVGLTILAVVLALGGVGFGGYWVYARFTATPPVTNAPSAPDPTPPEAATGAVAAATSVPGQLIEKAHDALSARLSIEQEGVAGVLKGREPGDERAIGARTPTELTAAMGGTVVDPPPASQNLIVRTTPDWEREPVAEQQPRVVVAEQVEPSAAFRAWVSELNVSGVFQGTPARALINGRTVREGELMNEGLGIVFDGVNAADKVLIFRDARGALVGKRY